MGDARDGEESGGWLWHEEADVVFYAKILDILSLLSLSQLLSLSSQSLRGEEPSRGTPYTSDLAAALTPHSFRPRPSYRVMDNRGRVIDPSQDPNVRGEIG